MHKSVSKNKIIGTILFTFFMILFVISLYKIFTWFNNSEKTTKLLDKINENVTIENIKNEDTEVIESTGNNIENIDLIDVNLSKLKSINEDTKGWIRVEGTKVDYPFVQTINNEYYLKHSFDKSYNVAGWVYLDYRNNLYLEEKNTIFYAHSMNNDTMFGTLKNTLEEEWINNKNNHYIKISTEHENTLWEVFSIYIIPTTDDYLKTNFTNDEEFNNFVNVLLKRSKVDFKVDISKKDHIITLSTCSGKKDKLVIHAKLVKKQVK